MEKLPSKQYKIKVAYAENLMANAQKYFLKLLRATKIFFSPAPRLDNFLLNHIQDVLS